MSTISYKELALLGLLCEKSMHAYEIETVIKERDMRHWTEISMSSVYKLLRKLENKDFLKSEVQVSDKNLVKKKYSITNLGIEVTKKKIKKIISKWEKPIRSLDIALSNLHLLDINEINNCFITYSESIDKMIQCYRELENYLMQNCLISSIQLASRPIHMLKAEKEWLEKFLKNLNSSEEKNTFGKLKSIEAKNYGK